MLHPETTFPEIDSLLEQREGSADEFYTEIEGFIETLQRDVQLLETKIHRQDSLTVASVAYRLKTSAKAFGIEAIHQSALQIESAARKNQFGLLFAEIDLMKYQVNLFVQSISCRLRMR